MKLFLFLENLISGFLPFTMLCICGLYLTVKGGFFQFRLFPESLRLTKKAFLNREKTKGVTSFQSACTALSATVGTGNIAGVAGAISLGGAGAVFWMWISALLGMAVKYTEISIAVRFRNQNGAQFSGGPMYYIENGLGKKFKPVSALFAISLIPAAFCTGNITQTNAAITSLSGSDSVKFIFGSIFFIITFAVIGGGKSKIGRVTEKIVPFMSVLYLLLSSGVIILNYRLLPYAFKLIIEGAFSPKAVTGGVIGSAFTSALIGASRGIFSNEAGLGTSAIAHSIAFDADSETQGLFGIFEVFIDTILICTLTALTILCGSVNIEYGKIASTELVAAAFYGCYGKFSSFLLSFMMCVFAISSIIGWALYGDAALGFLKGKKLRKIFLFSYPASCFIGALWSSDAVWRISSFFNGIMLCINLPVVLILSDTVLKKRESNDKQQNRKLKNGFRGYPSRFDYK